MEALESGGGGDSYLSSSFSRRTLSILPMDGSREVVTGAPVLSPPQLPSLYHRPPFASRLLSVRSKRAELHLSAPRTWVTRLRVDRPNAPRPARAPSKGKRPGGAQGKGRGCCSRPYQALCWKRRAGSVRKRLPNGLLLLPSLSGAAMGPQGGRTGPSSGAKTWPSGGRRRKEATNTHARPPADQRENSRLRSG